MKVLFAIMIFFFLGRQKSNLKCYDHARKKLGTVAAYLRQLLLLLSFIYKDLCILWLCLT